VEQHEAESIANILGGNAWNSGGNIWLVRLERADEKLVVLSDEIVCEYANEDAFETCNPISSIILH